MGKMKSDTPLDCAVFQLSPKRSRCELIVSSAGKKEKLASGLLKPFIAHLRVVEEQVASSSKSVNLEVGNNEKSDAWFTKGTLERFVRFVSTPEVLELANTFEAEMSQLEAARRIYSQGAGDHLSDTGGGGSGLTAAAAADDATKKELLRAIDVRLVAVQQDLCTACARAVAAGFDIDAVSELQIFADRFGAHRLNEACGKFIFLCERRSDLINPSKTGPKKDRAIQSSCGSDMSIDDELPSSPTLQESDTRQQPNPPSISTFQLRRTSSISRESSVERDDANKPNDTIPEIDGKDGTSTTIPQSISSSQAARRLSVQDRISMFENKQKETVVTKSVELRRMPYDVSASEKAVLRRWSGTSDMSIDLSVEKKDVDSTPLCTPSPAMVSNDNAVLISNVKTTATNSSALKKPETKIIPSLAWVSDGGSKDGPFNKSEQFLESSKLTECNGLKDQGGDNKMLLNSIINRNEKQESSEEKFYTLPFGRNECGDGFIYDKGKPKRSPSCEDLGGSLKKTAASEKDQGSSLNQTRPSESEIGRQVEISNQREGSVSMDEFISQTHPKMTGKVVGESGVIEDVAGSRIREAFAAHFKAIESNFLSAQQEVKSIGKTEVVYNREPHSSEEVVLRSSVADDEHSRPQRMKFGRQGSVTELSKKMQVHRDVGSFSGNEAPLTVKVKTEAQENSKSFSTPPPEQPHKLRQTKGNQDLNNELKFKANGLEKLFAEHKLRDHGKQTNSVHKGKSGDTLREPASSLQCSKLVVDASPPLFDYHRSAEPKFDASSLMKTVDNHGFAAILNKSFYDLSVLEGSRGKSYDKYMGKRDAKLREEWSSNRAEKEARLKSMQDSLNRSRSEMKARFSGFTDGQDSVSSSRRRAEKLRSYNSRSIMKREQKHLDYEDSEDGEGALDYVEEKDRALDDTSYGRDGISKGAQGKKLLTNGRILSSSTPRTAAAPLTRSATKTSTIIHSGKRRMQPDNPLAQSVPDFSDLRKESTKPSSGGSKTARLQVRNYSRSRRTIEEVDAAKEDKLRRSQTFRKSSENPSSEFNEMDSDGISLTPIRFDEIISRSVLTKTFLKKGSRTVFDARESIARQKASEESNTSNNVEENEVLASGPDDFLNRVNEEQNETLKTEDDKISDNAKERLSPELDSFLDSGSENVDSSTPFSRRVDQALGIQTRSELPSDILPIESTQDLPRESPISWNSRGQHPFSYPHEMSCVDNYVDSPVGSPALWNQMEIDDAARMRKNWGTAQKPMLVAHSSNNVTRKDRSMGFKRFLKFGRKNHGSESLLDWLSATTSEGDDDIEDGRDLANRSSEDLLRKSRMGVSLAQPSEDSYNESKFFNGSVQSSENSSIPAVPANFKLREDHVSGISNKAPRSFFSLSTFRSKGSDSKLR